MWFLVAIAMFGASARFGDDLVDDFALPGVESQRGTDVLEGRFPNSLGHPVASSSTRTTVGSTT